MKKRLLIVLSVFISCSNEPKPTVIKCEFDHSGFTQWHDAFNWSSDNYRKVANLPILKLIKGERDSVFYYQGKIDAYMAAETYFINKQRQTPKP